MLLFCIELIFKFQASEIESVRSKVDSLKTFVLDLDFFKNLLLVSVTQASASDSDYVCLTQRQAREILRKGNFYRTIKHVSEQIVYVGEEHVEWAVKFLEKFFEIEPEIFTDYLDKFKSIIDKSNQVGGWMLTPENLAGDHPVLDGNRDHHGEGGPRQVPGHPVQDPGPADPVVLEEEVRPLHPAEHVRQLSLQEAGKGPLLLLHLDHREPLWVQRGNYINASPNPTRSNLNYRRSCTR